LNWVYSSIIVVISYCIANVIETAFNWVWSGYNFSRFITIFRDEYHIQGFVISSLCFMVAYILKKYRLGFTFIHPTIVRPMPKVTYALILMSCINIPTSALTLFFWHDWVIISFVGELILLTIIFHLAFKREMSD